MIKKLLLTLLFLFIILQMSCGASKKVIIPIEMKNKALSLYSLKGVDKLHNSPICDSCVNKKLYYDMVNRESSLLHKNILSELRRCAKFGLYKVTDSIYPHDISIIIELSETQIQKDTLVITIKQTTTEISSRQKEIEEYKINSLIPQYDATNEKSLLYSAGRTLLSFRKNFPYEDLIKKYYSSE